MEGGALRDPAVAAFAHGLLDATEAVVGGDLVAFCVVGSLAMGDARPPTSDVDVLVVIGGRLDDGRRARLAQAVVDRGLACPWAGVEYVVYRADALHTPRYPLPFELNVNAGPRRTLRVSSGGDPPHWFLLDVAMAREHAIALRGPALHRIIGEPPRDAVVRALRDAVDWHLAHDHRAPNAVLATCRSLHWMHTGRWASKTDAGAWALAEAIHPRVVQQALDLRAAGGAGDLEEAAVRALLIDARERIA